MTSNGIPWNTWFFFEYTRTALETLHLAKYSACERPVSDAFILRCQPPERVYLLSVLLSLFPIYRKTSKLTEIYLPLWKLPPQT